MRRILILWVSERDCDSIGAPANPQEARCLKSSRRWRRRRTRTLAIAPQN